MTTRAQKAGNPINPAFTFWRENRKDQEFKLFAHDLIIMFEKWLPTKEKDWLQYYGSNQVIRIFLTDKAAVNSVFDEKEFNEIYEFLRPAYLKMI